MVLMFGSCVDSCPEEEFYLETDPSSGSSFCNHCSWGCKSCDSKEVCTECNEGFNFEQTATGNVFCKREETTTGTNPGTGVSTDPLDEEDDQPNDGCYIPHCDECNADGTSCMPDKCSRNYSLNSGMCVPNISQCLAPYCDECKPGSVMDCKTCETGFTLYESKCTKPVDEQSTDSTTCNVENCMSCQGDMCVKCNVGFFVDDILNKCRREQNEQPCHNQCEECMFGKCLFCKQGFELTATGSCVRQFSEDQCKQDHENCVKCSPTGECHMCDQEYELEGTSCVKRDDEICGVGSIPSSTGGCQKCSDSIANCLICWGPERCEFCDRGYKFNP